MAGMKTKGITYSLVGVDLGSQSIKAVAISGRRGKYTTQAYDIPTPAGVIEDGQIKDLGKLELTLRELFKSFNVKPKFVATSVSGTRPTTKIIELDAKLSDSALQKAVEEEVDNILSGDRIYDYEILQQEGDKNKVLISVVSSDLVNDRVATFSNMNVQVKVMDVSIHALARAVRDVVGESVLKASKHVALLDIGAQSLSFAVLDEDFEVSYHRVVPSGGNQLTENLSMATGMDLESAEKMKIEDRIPEANKPIEDAYVNSVIRNAERLMMGQRDIDTVIVTGGGALLKRLQTQLRSFQQKKVIFPDMSKVMKPGSKVEDGLKYMTALGLALRSFEPCPI